MNTQNRPIKVLFLNFTKIDASEYTVHLNLSEAVDPQDVHSYFIFQRNTHDPAMDAQKNPNLGPNSKVYFHDFGRNQFKNMSRLRRAIYMALRYPFNLYQLYRTIKEIQPDVLYTSQQWYEVRLAHRASKFFGIPHIIHISYNIGPWLGERVLKIIRDSKHLIACSDYIKYDGIPFGVDPDPIQRIYHIANFERYQNERNPDELRRSLDLPLDTPLLLAAARLDKNKGYILLLKALAHVKKEVPNVKLLALGVPSKGTTHHEKIHQLVKDLDLTDNVIFLGWQTNLEFYMSGVDVFTLPTLVDALPLVFLAAMVSGLPCVAVRDGGVPEMVSHGETGFLAEPGQEAELAEYITRLLKDKALAAQMGTAGKAYAAEKFDHEKIAAEWVNYLRTIIQPTN